MFLNLLRRLNDMIASFGLFNPQASTVSFQSNLDTPTSRFQDRTSSGKGSNTLTGADQR